MKNKFILLLCGLLLAMGQSALAQTPDGETPSEELICAEETGALKGLCNAYCEAMDCNLSEAIHASPKACARVLDNYLKKSGGANPPCLDAGCAATATRIANEFYADCITSNSCDHDLKCAQKARSVYKYEFRRCFSECRYTCSAEYKSCRGTATAVYNTCISSAGDDLDAQLQCKIDQSSALHACKLAVTQCTDNCVGPTEPYTPPSECPTP